MRKYTFYGIHHFWSSSEGISHHQALRKGGDRAGSIQP